MHANAAPEMQASTTLRLEVGENLLLNGQPFFVTEINRAQVLLKHSETGLSEIKKPQEMVSLYFGNKLILCDRSGTGMPTVGANDNFDIPFDLYPEADKTAARRLHAYVSRIRAGFPDRIGNSALRRAIIEIAADIGDNAPRSPKQMRRYLTRWDESGGDIRSLLPQTHKRGNRSPRLVQADSPKAAEALSRELARMISDAITRAFYRREDTDVSIVEAHLIPMVEKWNERALPDQKIGLPSTRTLRRAIAKRLGYVMDVHRIGKKAADRKYAPSYRSHRAERPLEVVEMDTKILDLIFNLPGDGGTISVRGHVTLMIDSFTRMVVGFHFSTGDAPDHNSALMCLFTAIRDKEGILRQHPKIQGAWPCFGRPEAVLIDNGSEFANQHFTDACAQLGIEIIWCEAGKPEQKPAVERFFGTGDTKVIHKLPGTTFGSPKERGDYKSSENAVFSLEEVEALFVRYVVDEYSRSFHHGIEDTPLNRWEMSITDFPPILPRSVHDLSILLSRMERRVIQKKGIEFCGLYYNSPELARIRNGEDGKQVTIKINEADLSSILVQDPNSKRYIDVPSTNIVKTHGLTLAARKQDMAETQRRKKKAEEDPIRRQARVDRAMEIDARRPPQATTTNVPEFPDPYRTISPEVEIRASEAAIPPSPEGFDDLFGHDTPAASSDRSPSPDGAFQEWDLGTEDHDDIDAWRKEQGRD